MEGQGLYWSIDDLKKAYVTPSTTVAQVHLAWVPEYRLTIVKRPHLDPAKTGAEMHDDKTQIYFILGGTGTQIVGGKPSGKDDVRPEGQHGSVGPLAGGKSFKVKGTSYCCLR